MERSTGHQAMASRRKFEPLPYRWRPLGTTPVTVPEVGQIIAWHHEAWRVIDIRLRPEVDWSAEEREYVSRGGPESRFEALPRNIIARPVRITADDPRSRDHDVHLSRAPGCAWGFDVYDSDHYPVCAQCGEPVPCREEMARKLTEDATAKANRYSLPGVCPACGEPVTPRQKVVTFEENLRVPFGPPVTFHSTRNRRNCRYDAVRYEWELADAIPGYVVMLSCPGHIRRHVDGLECSEGEACRGVRVEHRKVSYYCEPSCPRCTAARAASRDSLAARNAAGDWTVWSD